MSSLVILSPQAQESALNFVGGSVSNNPSTGAVDITTALGISGQRSVYTLAANQSTPNSVTTFILFDTKYSDSLSMYDASSGKFTIPVGLGGVWLAWSTIVFAGQGGGGVGVRGAGVWVNGNNSPPNTTGTLVVCGTTNFVQLATCVPLFLNAGDFVQFSSFQSSGGNLNVLASSYGGIIKLV